MEDFSSSLRFPLNIYGSSHSHWAKPRDSSVGLLLGYHQALKTSHFSSFLLPANLLRSLSICLGKGLLYLHIIFPTLIIRYLHFSLLYMFKWIFEISKSFFFPPIPHLYKSKVHSRYASALDFKSCFRSQNQLFDYLFIFCCWCFPFSRQ